LEGGRIKNPERNCLQKQKSPNKLSAHNKKHCLQEDAAGKKLFAQTTTLKKLFVLKK